VTPLLAQSLPIIDQQYYYELEKNGINVKDILKQVNNFPESSQLEVACLMALCGWMVDSNIGDCIFCQYCQRRIGLWNFKQQQFHPLQQHRFFCIWVVQYHQTDTGEITKIESGGWLKIAQQLSQ